MLAELTAEHVAPKKALRRSEGQWVAPDIRDEVVDFVRRWSEKTEISVERFLVEFVRIKDDRFFGPLTVAQVIAMALVLVGLWGVQRTWSKGGLPVTVETCPHYLFFDAESIPDGNPVFKCAPPIREGQNNLNLWTAIEDGLIDFVVTDHSPTTPENKEIKSGDLYLAWGGISGLQFSLPAVWTRAREKGVAIEKVSQLMSSKVAEFLQLGGKGNIEPGFDADLLIWDPEESFRPAQSSIEHRHKFSPYVGAEMFGVIKATYVDGYKVFDEGHFGKLNKGKRLLR